MELLLSEIPENFLSDIRSMELLLTEIPENFLSDIRSMELLLSEIPENFPFRYQKYGITFD